LTALLAEPSYSPNGRGAAKGSTSQIARRGEHIMPVSAKVGVKLPKQAGTDRPAILDAYGKM
jgi:hypothetical protein